MQRETWAACLGVLAVCAVAAVSLSASAGQDNGWNLGFGATGAATAQEVGLPFYPGAWPHKDKDHDSSAAYVWASAGPFGMKVAVAELQTNDPPDKVAAFYRPALARYGALVDCSAGRRDNGNRAPGELNCKSDSPSPGEVIIKAGRDMDQHIVTIRPEGQGSIIDLVFVHLEGLGG